MEDEYAANNRLGGASVCPRTLLNLVSPYRVEYLDPEHYNLELHCEKYFRPYVRYLRAAARHESCGPHSVLNRYGIISYTNL